MADLHTVFSAEAPAVEDPFSSLLMDLDDDFMSFLDREFQDLPFEPAAALELAPASEEPASAAASASGHWPASPSRGEASSESTSGMQFPLGEPHHLPVQRCAGPPTSTRKQARGVVVTTEQAAAAPVPPPAPKKQQRLESSPFHSEDEEEESDSEMSHETDVHCAGSSEGHKAGKTNKRKAPEVDWRAIADPAERRRQRRLAKNRVTAARSRDRKKSQWADMEAKLNNLDSDNKRLRAMLEQLASENSMLRGQLGLAQGEPAANGVGGTSTRSTESAALVLISIMLLLCCSLPPDSASLFLGSVAPLVLLAALQLSHSSASTGRLSLSDSLLSLLAKLSLLFSKASRKLRRTVHRALFRRHAIAGGRAAMRAASAWAASSHDAGNPLLVSSPSPPVASPLPLLLPPLSLGLGLKALKPSAFSLSLDDVFGASTTDLSSLIKEEPCTDLLFNPLPMLMSIAC